MGVVVTTYFHARVSVSFPKFSSTFLYFCCTCYMHYIYALIHIPIMHDGSNKLRHLRPLKIMAVVLLYSVLVQTNIICNVSQLFIEITYQFVLTWYSRHFQLAGITVLLNKGLKINRYAIVSIVTRQFSTHRLFTTILSLYSFSLRTNLFSWQLLHNIRLTDSV